MDSSKCPIHSSQVGNNEMLYATVSKGKSYVLVMDYTSSILSLTSFYDCPNTHFKIAMMNTEQANKIVNEHNDKVELNKLTKESEQRIVNFFNSLSSEVNDDMEHRMEPKWEFHYPLDARM